MLKALGAYGLYLIVVGIRAQDHLLTYYNDDLTGLLRHLHGTITN